MDDPQGAEAHPMRLLQIVFHHRFHFSRRNGVQIENVGDWNANRLVIRRFVHNCC